MSKKSAIVIMLVAIAFGIFFASPMLFSQQEAEQNVNCIKPKYEYTTAYYVFDSGKTIETTTNEMSKILNQYASQGWRLVGQNSGWQTFTYFYYFERKIPIL
jgi:hypothetical protein